MGSTPVSSAGHRTEHREKLGCDVVAVESQPIPWRALIWEAIDCPELRLGAGPLPHLADQSLDVGCTRERHYLDEAALLAKGSFQSGIRL